MVSPGTSLERRRLVCHIAERDSDGTRAVERHKVPRSHSKAQPRHVPSALGGPLRQPPTYHDGAEGAALAAARSTGIFTIRSTTMLAAACVLLGTPTLAQSNGPTPIPREWNAVTSKPPGAYEAVKTAMTSGVGSGTIMGRDEAGAAGCIMVDGRWEAAPVWSSE